MNKRNLFLDFWKYLAAIGVILVHIKFPGPAGETLSAFGSGGVLLFALISGYACYGESEEASKKILRRLKRNGVITVITLAIYVLFSFFLMSSTGQFDQWKNGFCSPVSYLRMIVLGDFEFFYAAPLWYLVAIIYCYIIFYFLIRNNLKRVIYFLLPVTTLLRIAVSFYISLPGTDWHLRNNFIAGLLPLMCIGYVIADQKEKLDKLSVAFLITVSIVSALAMIITVNFQVFGINISQPFTILCVTSLFMTGIKKPEWYISKPVAYLGQKDTLYIYLSHAIVILVMSYLINIFPVSEDLKSLILPVLSVIVSVLLARLLSIVLPPAKKNNVYNT